MKYIKNGKLILPDGEIGISEKKALLFSNKIVGIIDEKDIGSFGFGEVYDAEGNVVEHLRFVIREAHVAEFDRTGEALVGGNGVIFVDDGQRAQLQQPLQCVVDMDASAGVFDVIGSQQQLGSVKTVFAALGIVKRHKFALPDRGKRLNFGKLFRTFFQPQRSHTGTDGTGRNQHNFVALFPQSGNSADNT